MNFRNFDLNLLRVLNGMLIARNTTRVGEMLGLSQPAVSAGLARLRDALGDPLFIRQGNTLVPTSLALNLQEPVRTALMNLEHALSGGGNFDPATNARAFTLAGSDYFTEMLMPELANVLMNTAPNVTLKTLPADVAQAATLLAADSADVVLLIPAQVPDWIEQVPVFHSSFVVAARNGHSRLQAAGLAWGQTLPIELFCGIPHAVFSVQEDFARLEDQALSRLGRERRITVSVAGFYGVGRVLAQSDLLGVLPTRFALSIARRLGLQLYRLPLEMPMMRLQLYWHKRDTFNREHAWLRGIILNLLAPLDELNFPLLETEFAQAK
ncbi:LysR family transcriptional regulator [Roseiarcaceae bacterium H3SJ34-1]|uniref:LysR family transcriptional regulator n=1 Tax=Terripilifer ovatus TaxID=3032367 RepID=UPI003AB97531|nr:LysR family transcriptional regulator [Roseiarcaceae bacterium H3SJ34-1]